MYTVERLNRARILDAKDEERTDAFFADARLPRDERAELSDYLHSGFDKGHMGPAKDMPNADAMAQSFSLANMVPQAPINNRKTWASIEKSTRKYVMRARGDVFVFTGPAFLKDVGRLKNRVAIPSHLFKLVYDESSGRAWAHLLPNTDEAQAGPPISYEALTSTIGYDLMPGLNPQH